MQALSSRRSRALALSAGRKVICCSNCTCRTDGTGQNCVKTTDSPTGPVCAGPKVGVCCDAFNDRDNCLTASGSSCASYGPDGDTPLTAFCCDQLDQPNCPSVNTASDCPVGSSSCNSELALSLQLAQSKQHHSAVC